MIATSAASQNWRKKKIKKLNEEFVFQQGEILVVFWGFFSRKFRICFSFFGFNRQLLS